MGFLLVFLVLQHFQQVHHLGKFEFKVRLLYLSSIKNEKRKSFQTASFSNQIFFFHFLFRKIKIRRWFVFFSLVFRLHFNVQLNGKTLTLIDRSLSINWSNVVEFNSFNVERSLISKQLFRMNETNVENFTLSNRLTEPPVGSYAPKKNAFAIVFRSNCPSLVYAYSK